MTDLVKDYEQAEAVSYVPYWIQLVGSLAMSGLKIMPSRLVPKAGKNLRKVWAEEYISVGYGSERDFYGEIGFVFVENHCRSHAHELWQSDLGGKNKGAWVIPIDEIIAITHDDPHACDYISVQRLLFEGTEGELEAAIDKIGSALKRNPCPTSQL